MFFENVWGLLWWGWGRGGLLWWLPLPFCLHPPACGRILLKTLSAEVLPSTGVKRCRPRTLMVCSQKTQKCVQVQSQKFHCNKPSYIYFEKLFFQKFNLTFPNWINPTVSVLFIHSVAKVDLFQLNLLFTQPWLTIIKGWFKICFDGIIPLRWNP